MGRMEREGVTFFSIQMAYCARTYVGKLLTTTSHHQDYLYMLLLQGTRIDLTRKSITGGPCIETSVTERIYNG